jgi:AraC-like DNA-binding protein
MRKPIDTSGIYPINRVPEGAGGRYGLERINPALITAYYFFPLERWKRGLALHSRVVTDYELEFVLSSDGGRQVIDGISYHVSEGDVIFRRPGETTRGFMRYDCICLIFSLDGTLPALDEYPINGVKPVQARFENPAIDALESLVPTGSDGTFRALFERVIGAFVNPGDFSEVLEKACLAEILYRYLRLAGRRDAAGRNREEWSDPLRERLEETRLWMRDNLATRITVADAAARAKLSEAYYHKRFTRAFAVTPAEYLASVRLERARELLAATDMPIRAIAIESGFENESYFYRFFLKKTGQTPGAFRRSHRMPGI